MKMRRLLCPALFGAALFLSACDVHVGDNGGVSVDLAHGKATDQWTRSYTIARGGQLEIINVSGPIDVVAAPGAAVNVHAVREARAGSDDAARTLLETQPKLTEQVAADHVRIEVQNPSGEGGGFSPRTSVQFRVEVPAGLQATFRTRNGQVRLDNVDGRFDAQTTNGGVTGRDVTGSIRASTVNGSVQMGIIALRGDIDLRAVNGGIRLEIPPTLDADVDVSTVNGGVSIDDALSIATTEQSRSHVAGRLNKGGPKILAQTTNGGVRLRPRAGR